jgi:NitT/TauT family transport system ATP-binding protein
VESIPPGTHAIVSESLAFAWDNPDGTQTPAIAGMDFTVAPGEFVAILGPSGCGKSSFLNLVAGLETPTAGKLVVDGQSVNGVSTQRFLIAQQAYLFPWLNVARNVEFGPRMRGDSLADRRSASTEILQAVGLADWGNVFPHQLSGGMKQRAAIARALVNEPKILLMDEPFAALDYPARLEMQDFLLRVHRKFNPTVLFVTHMPEEALLLADRIIVFSKRPAHVQREIEVCLPRPRKTTELHFNQLQEELLSELETKKHSL